MDVGGWLPLETEDFPSVAAGEQYAAQELLALLPPGTGVGQVEAMIKELRTTAALEVRWAGSDGTVCLLGAQGQCCSEWCWLHLPVLLWCSGVWLLWAPGTLCARRAASMKGKAGGRRWYLVTHGTKDLVAGLPGTGTGRAGAVGRGLPALLSLPAGAVQPH